MNQDVPKSRLPKRCGNCRHAVKTASFDGSPVACIVRLEYHSADRSPDCQQYHAVDYIQDVDDSED